MQILGEKLVPDACPHMPPPRQRIGSPELQRVRPRSCMCVYAFLLYWQTRGAPCNIVIVHFMAYKMSHCHCNAFKRPFSLRVMFIETSNLSSNRIFRTLGFLLFLYSFDTSTFFYSNFCLYSLYFCVI